MSPPHNIIIPFYLVDVDPHPVPPQPPQAPSPVDSTHSEEDVKDLLLEDPLPPQPATPPANPLLISDVVCLSGTYLILLIRIRLYLCRLDYILSMFLLYLPFWISLLSFFIRTSYCSFTIVLFRDIPFVSKWTIVLYHNRQSRLSL